MAYRLALLNSLKKVHDVFHVSQLKCYFATASHILDPKPLDFDPTLSYAVQYVRILDTKVRSTKRKVIRYANEVIVINVKRVRIRVNLKI